ncbi:MAG: D-aminoacyl-tRNA deacylase [Anaerolineae bacterium]
MRAVVQRVARAEVRIDGQVAGAVGRGLLVLVAVAAGDTRAQADWLAAKIPSLRLFPGEKGHFEESLAEVSGGLLVVSQFTLYADTRKGRRPSFSGAAPPAEAAPLYEYFVDRLRQAGWPVATGRFGELMAVELVNDGPVTLVIDT